MNSPKSNIAAAFVKWKSIYSCILILAMETICNLSRSCFERLFSNTPQVQLPHLFPIGRLGTFMCQKNLLWAVGMIDTSLFLHAVLSYLLLYVFFKLPCPASRVHWLHVIDILFFVAVVF